jgi:hypothetical protein
VSGFGVRLVRHGLPGALEARLEPLDDSNDDDVGLPDQARWAALLDEHRKERFGLLWLQETSDAARAVCVRYPPLIYARRHRWDEDAIDDLTQEVTVHRMLEKSQVEYICDTAHDLLHARRLVRRQVRMTLLTRRSWTVVDNLIRRAMEVLNTGPYERDPGPPISYRMVGVNPPGDRARAERDVATRLRQFPRLAGGGTERGSAVWTSATLREAVETVMSTFGVATQADLDKIFSDALTCLAPSELVSNELGTDRSDDAPTPEETAMANDLARQVHAALLPAERAVLALKCVGVTDSDAGLALNVSRQTIDARKRAAHDKVREVLRDVDDPTRDSVLLLMAERLLSEGPGFENAP